MPHYEAEIAREHSPLKTGVDSKPSDGREDDIAVVGFDLRFPQDGDSPEGFRKMMEERRSAMTEYPADRLNVDAFHQPSLKPGSIVMRGGHFLKGTLSDIAAFDADFFSVHPSEAVAMDPQQRILLESTYRAFENAGIRIEDVRGSDTSVVTGAFTMDYFTQTLKDPEDQPAYMALGTSGSMLANRVSWFFDLSGPSYNIDAACASSALAVQQACEQLRRGDVSMAVVAGCNLMLDPTFSVSIGSMQLVSRDSLSYSFDTRANGYARGEGIGVVVLKRVLDAVDHRDPIRAVIRACRSSSDGRTPGITQPSSEAQARLIEETYAKAHLSKGHTLHFEAHGTGTPAGDPVEANAIIRTFSPHRSRESPIHIGAVKSFIGHLEGGAGIAALLKTVMSLESGVIFPNINFEKMNPQIYDPDDCVVFPQQSTPWPQCEIRRASINSFGYGGSNCHIVVDDAYSYLRDRALSAHHHTDAARIGSSTQCNGILLPVRNALSPSANHSGSSHDYKLLLWSANDEHSLEKMVGSWKEYVASKVEAADNKHDVLDQISFNLCLRRSFLTCRSFAVVTDDTDFATLSPEPSVSKTQKRLIAFAFTGQGAQWSGMGRELMRFKPFAAVIEEATRYVHSFGAQWSVKEELLKDAAESQIDDPSLAAPLTTIVQIALVELLREVGIVPAAVCGHSIGEIAAAYCTGLFSIRDAVYLAYYRGIYVSSVPIRDPVKGGMLAVGLSASDASEYFKRVKTPKVKYDLSVSCENSPSNVTVSGEDVQLSELQSLLSADGVFARRVRVGAAYHSSQLAQIADECTEKYQKVQFSQAPPKIHMISTLTGLPISSEEMGRPEYWVDNMIYPVLFKQAIERMCAKSHGALTKKLDGSHRSAIVVDDIIEVGPHSALKGPIQQILAGMSLKRDISYSSPLVRKQPADKTFLQLLGQYFQAGIPIHLEGLFEPSSSGNANHKVLTDAPRYQFNHSRVFWHESYLGRDHRLKPYGHTELLGNRALHWRSFCPEWRYRIIPSDVPWLSDHVVGGAVLYPAAAMVLAAIQGAKQLSDAPDQLAGFTLTQLQFVSPIVFRNLSDTVEMRCVLQPADVLSQLKSSRYALQIYCLSDGSWKLNCSGFIEGHQSGEHQATWLNSSLAEALEDQAKICSEHVAKGDFYEALSEQGIQYGTTFQGITDAWYDDCGRAMVKIDVPDSSVTDGTASRQPLIHPGTLDSIFHMLLVALSKGGTESIAGAVVQGFDKLWLSSSLVNNSESTIKAACRLSSDSSQASSGSTFAISESGEALLTLDGLRATAVDAITAPVTSSAEFSGSSYNIVTDIDIELLTPQEVQERLLRPPFSNQKLQTYIRWCCFKNPDLDVLEVGNSSTKYTKTLFDAFRSPATGVAALSTFTYAGCSEALCEEVESQLLSHGEKVLFQEYDMEQDLIEQGFKLAEYDIIFCPETDQRVDTKANLNNLRKLLKPGGKIILIEDVSFNAAEKASVLDLVSDLAVSSPPNHLSSPSTSKEAMNVALATAGFSTDNITFTDLLEDSDSRVSVTVATAEETQRTANITQSITILVDSSSELQALLAHELLVALEGGAKVEVRILGLNDDATTSFGTLISLLEYDKPLFSTIGSSDFTKLRSMLLSSRDVLWVTQGLSASSHVPGYGMAAGFAKVFPLEHIDKRMVTVELNGPSIDQRFAIDAISRILPKLSASAASPVEEQYTVKDGALCISRYVSATPSASAIDSILSGETVTEQSLASCRPFKITGTRVESDQVTEAQSGEAEVVVTAMTLPIGHSESNDVYRACAGTLSQAIPGFNAADRVCAFAKSGIQSNLTLPSTDLARIPDSVTVVEAVAVLQEGHLAHHILENLVRLSRKQSMLIHGPSSVLKHCIIALALNITSSIYVTATAVEERDQLRSTFGEHALTIVLQQDLSGELSRLGSKRADVVIELSTKQLTQELINCVSPFGQIIKCTKDTNTSLTSVKLPSNVALRTVDESACQHESYVVEDVLPQSLMDRLLKYRLPAFDDLQAVQLSALLTKSQTTARHLVSGKLDVVEFSEDDIIPYTRSVKTEWAFSSDATYLIAGGLGDLGRLLARWMVERGAKNLVLLSRSGPKSDEAVEMVQDLERLGTKVFTPKCDISDPDALSRVLGQCTEQMPPIKGCIQASAVLKDVLYENMSPADWHAATRPKVQGTWNLHTLLPSSLDFFILTSSLTGILGLPGQSNYAAGNAFQDALARFRTSQGLPCTSLDLGLLTTGGIAAADAAVLARLERDARYMPLSASQIRAIFEHFCDPATDTSDPNHAQFVAGIRSPSAILAAALDLPDNMKMPTWSLLRPTRREIAALESSTGSGGGDGVNSSVHADAAILTRLEKAARESTAAARDVVLEALARRIARLLALPESAVGVERPLNAYGADSLTGIELRAWIVKTFGVDVPVFDLLGDTSIAETGGVVARLWLDKMVGDGKE